MKTLEKQSEEQSMSKRFNTSEQRYSTQLGHSLEESKCHP